MKSRRSTPLEPYRCSFRDHLSSQGYSDNRLALHLRHMEHLGRWLDEQGVDLSNFSLSHVEAFLFERRAAYPYLSRLSLRGLAPLLDYLPKIDVLPEPQQSASTTPVDQLLKEFADYLQGERGLADDTVAHYRHTASRFLAQRAARLEAGEGIENLEPQEVAAFVLAEAERLKSSSRQSVVAPESSVAIPAHGWSRVCIPDRGGSGCGWMARR